MSKLSNDKKLKYTKDISEGYISIKPQDAYPSQYILEDHRKEWEEGSAIAPELIEANLKSIAPHQEALNPWEEEDIPESYYILYPLADEDDRRNDGRIRNPDLKRIRSPHVAGGGWYSNGFNLLTGERSNWGTYKPNTPRWDFEKGKYRKYEHPNGVPTQPYIPAVPIAIADWWLSQYEGWKEFKESYQGDEEFMAWAFTLTHPEVPINITEGNKKVNSLLTHKGMTVGVTGIWNWIDSEAPRHWNPETKTSYREKILTHLLTPLCCEGREFNLLFDEDPKPKTQKDVRKAAIALGDAIASYGCEVFIGCWDSEKGKGIDDAIATYGSEFLEEIKYYDLEGYRMLGTIKAQQELNSLTYPINLRLNTPRLPDLTDKIPDSGIIAIKSAKGSGKSWQIKEMIKLWEAKGKQVISITPRIALGRGQAVEWKISWIDDLGRVQEVSVGLCWDSLQKVAHLDWSNAVIIIDESELGFEHLLSSSTCKDRRPKLLRIFQEKIKECLDGEGTVLLSDADITDISIGYIKGISPDAPLYIIQNDAPPALWKGIFSTGKVDETIDMLFEDIENGEKMAVATDSQAQAEALDKEISSRYPDILIERVDGKTTQEEEGKQWVKYPNNNILQYQPDILIYTPSMGVGVSITQPHFTKNYAFFNGVLSPSQCRQMLGRVRLPIPRVIWAKDRGLLAGDAPLTPSAVKCNIHENVNDGLSLMDLIKTDGEENLDIEAIYQVISDIRNGGEWDNIHLETYAKLKARRNYGLSQLALQLREELKEEGHEIIDFYSSENTNLGDSLREGKEELKKEEAKGIHGADDISLKEAQEMSYQPSLTEKERYEMQKAFIKEELPEADLTPEFIFETVVKDKRKTLNAHKLFWFLNNPDIAKYLDNREIFHHGKQFSEGVTFLPDIRMISPKIKLLEELGVMEILAPHNLGKTFTNNDEELIEFHKKCCSQRKRIKRVLGITVSNNLTPMQLLQMIAEKVGLKLRMRDRKRVDGKITRIYQIDQEALLSPYRIEVLTALDRKGEAILQKAHSKESYCDTPPNTVNKIGGDVTALSHALEFSEMLNESSIGLGDRFTMLWSFISNAGEKILGFLKPLITDPHIAKELA